jgi:hypothetical protein
VEDEKRYNVFDTMEVVEVDQGEAWNEILPYF